jgi:hypothetical protein
VRSSARNSEAAPVWVTERVERSAVFVGGHIRTLAGLFGDLAEVVFDDSRRCRIHAITSLAVGRDAKISDKFFGHSCSVTSSDFQTFSRQTTSVASLVVALMPQLSMYEHLCL